MTLEIKGYKQGIEETLKKVEEVINNEKEIVKLVCLGLMRPPQENQKEFTNWLQETVIFHLNQVELKLKERK